MEDILKTCLHQKHLDLGAKMMPFGGFDMPIEYTTIIEEHNAVRHAAGIFDVSHMGEILITGPDSERYINHIFTNDIRNAEIGKIFYGMMLYPEGGTVDDLLVYKMEEERFFFLLNASNIAKDFQWIVEHSTGYDLKIENLSDYYGEVAVQGPTSNRSVSRQPNPQGRTCLESTNISHTRLMKSWLPYSSKPSSPVYPVRDTIIVSFSYFISLQV